MQLQTPPVRDLVLLGGGHAHVQVLRSFAMKPLPGVRLTIIAREVLTPYSGMLPGHIAGIYDADEIHIDLGPLAVFAGARMIADEVVALDLQNQRLELSQHPALRFDLLSINSGAVPLGVGEHVIPVKPIGRFLPGWEEVKRTVQPGQRVSVVGAGAGGVELVLAMRRSLPASVHLRLVSEDFLDQFPTGVGHRMRRALESSGVDLQLGFRVDTATAGELLSDDGRRLESQHTFWVTNVAAPTWPAAAGLATDEAGFISVDRHLQSVSHPQVFAAGDIADLQHQERPKAGVFAVREGPTLSTNLRRSILGRPLKRFNAQRRFLVMIGTGDRRAVATKGRFVVEGAWVWRWKDWIDRRFMARFNELPQMPQPKSELPEALQNGAPDLMRCGGCGAKLGASPLLRVLDRLPAQNFPQVTLGIGDDAAIVRSEGRDVILTVDGFRSLISDTYLFGRITAHHALNDILAMGGKGVSALALATVPLMAEAMMEDDLYQMLRGAVDVLNESDVALVGGHSAEGAELSLSLTVTGVANGGALLPKSGLRSGDVLLLTKPIGTGVVLAGHMRGQVDSATLQHTIESLDTSNAGAIGVLKAFNPSAATDVSGFGLLGHLAEMLAGAALGVELDLASVPVLPGAADQMAAGVNSSLQENNERVLSDFSADPACDGNQLRLLVDPQTSGGLLAGVPADRADECLQALHAAGYPQAARIGQVRAGEWRILAQQDVTADPSSGE